MKRLACLLLLLFPLSFAMADSISTIELRNRTAEELMPIIKPMLGPDDALTGQGFQLFLRASPATREQIEGMVRKLDVAATTLLVSVFQGSEQDLRDLSIQGHLSFETQNGDVTIGRPPQPGGSGLRIETPRIDTRISSTRRRLQDNPIHQLRVLEGSAGFIETGQSIPYFTGPQWVAPGTAVSGMQYRDVTTGFYVLPRTHGEQVTLDISPFKQSLSRTRGGDIDTQRARTTVTGPLGEWLLIGGVAEQSRQSTRALDGYQSTRARGDSSIWIRADRVQ